MGKSEDRRAAIVAQQAARELAERAARLVDGKEPRAAKRRTNWAASPRVGAPARSAPKR